MKFSQMIWMLVVVFVGIGLLLWGTGAFSLSGTSEEETGIGDYSYAGKNVEVSLQSTNKYTASSVDPTFYIYDEEPENWGNGRVSVQDGYISSESSSSGTATLTEEPGTYYVRGVLSNYYDQFVKVTVPATGDVPLSQYNDGGEEIVKINFLDVETLSTSNVDMGISTNETSDKTYTVYANFNVDDDEAFMIDEIKFQEDATYSFATDSDGDGVYDEGINELIFTIDGTSYTLFDVASSIDEFSGDDTAEIDFNNLYEENTALNMKFEVTCDATLDEVGDGDSKCGDSEDFLDSVILVDGAGNTATFDLTG